MLYALNAVLQFALLYVLFAMPSMHAKRPLTSISQTPQIISELLEDDGTFPNNNNLPLLIYKNAIELPSGNAAYVIENVFNSNHWGSMWRNGIYGFHHYHSTAHEVLGVYRGHARVQLGGPRGVEMEVARGDVILIPAGVAHKNLDQSSDFAVVGAYPVGQTWDMNYGKPEERPQADQNIARVPLPKSDPVYGIHGPLKEYWKK